MHVAHRLTSRRHFHAQPPVPPDETLAAGRNATFMCFKREATMATQTAFAWLIACALAAAALQRGDAPLPDGPYSHGESHGGASQRVLRIAKDDGITAGQLGALRRKSTIARELLDRVGGLPATILILRADPLLVRQSGVYGRSRFWINGAELFGYVQYQATSLGNPSTECVIVHELAHAVEIAMADRRGGTPGLREFLLSRAPGNDPSNWRGAETAFPRDVAVAVMQELFGRTPRTTFEALADAHHVTLPTVPAVSVARAAPSNPR
jgi:hypothetical protein